MAPVISDRGFSLIEVLIAMLILAIGLMGLEALGIGAARAVTRAQKQSDFSFMATDTLERTLGWIRRGAVVGAGTSSGTFGNAQAPDSLRISITSTPIVGTTRAQQTVSVTVVPYPQSKVLGRADSVRVEGYVYR